MTLTEKAASNAVTAHSRTARYGWALIATGLRCWSPGDIVAGAIIVAVCS